MQLTARIAAMPEAAQRRALELVPELGPVLVGTDAEVARRWASFAKAFGPVVARRDPEAERLVLALVKIAGKLPTRDLGMLLGSATRLALKPSAGTRGRASAPPPAARSRR